MDEMLCGVAIAGEGEGPMEQATRACPYIMVRDPGSLHERNILPEELVRQHKAVGCRGVYKIFTNQIW